MKENIAYTVSAADSGLPIDYYVPKVFKDVTDTGPKDNSDYVSAVIFQVSQSPNPEEWTAESFADHLKQNQKRIYEKFLSLNLGTHVTLRDVDACFLHFCEEAISLKKIQSRASEGFLGRLSSGVRQAKAAVRSSQDTLYGRK